MARVISVNGIARQGRGMAAAIAKNLAFGASSARRTGAGRWRKERRERMARPGALGLLGLRSEN
jgi:hypothetical protein